MKTRDTFGDYNYWELFDIKNLKPRKTTTTKIKETTSSTEKQTTEKIKDEDRHSMNNFTITMSVSFEDMPTTCDCKILK